MNINFDQFLTSLDVMWKGMLGIFAVVAIIVACVLVLRKLFPIKNIDKKD
ncbi:MAG: sodium pump decarboxylase gamma subunit [Clostridia bacterium]